MPATSIDWEKLLADIAWLIGEPAASNPDLRTPLSTQAVANWLGVPRMTLIGWRDGSQPKHMEGEYLIAKWCQISGKKREFAPTCTIILSAAKCRTA